MYTYPALIRGTHAKFDHVIRRVYFLVKSSTNAKFVSSLFNFLLYAVNETLKRVSRKLKNKMILF